MDDNFTNDLWVEYASLQGQSNKVQKLGHTAWAIENQLDSFLESFTNSSFPTDKEEREKQRTNLLINRQKKYRHRARLLQRQTASIPTSSPSNYLILRLIQSEQIVKIRMLVTEEEMRILWGLALDFDYNTLAKREGLSVAALKTKVCRCRQRLHKRLQRN